MYTPYPYERSVPVVPDPPLDIVFFTFLITWKTYLSNRDIFLIILHLQLL